MINQAMFQPRNQFNEFTVSLRTLCQQGDGCRVQLRNQSIFKVHFEPETDRHEAMFRSEFWDLVWNLDGSSCTSRDLDIVAFGDDINT